MREILQQHKFDGEILEKPKHWQNVNFYESGDIAIDEDVDVDQASLDDCKRYNNAQTVYELVTMTEFIDELRTKEPFYGSGKSRQQQGCTQQVSDNDNYDCIIEYCNFITQPLTEEMFIGDGRIFEGWTLERDFFDDRDSIRNTDRCLVIFYMELNKITVLGRTIQTIEQALNNGVKLFWNGKTI